MGAIIPSGTVVVTLALALISPSAVAVTLLIILVPLISSSLAVTTRVNSNELDSDRLSIYHVTSPLFNVPPVGVSSAEEAVT